ncbi:MAG TPA: c-type cytochrome [Candidatus Acidoferrales bacterium]|nr:c-type cytochrome [Candidatus Acidoferrales bacterium]
MLTTRVPKRGAAVFVLIMAGTLAAGAQQQSMQGKTAEQVYKNIKVLNGTPADQLNLAMHLVEGELGVDCTFCHVDHEPSHFQLDDNKKKETARKMMQMVIDINKNNFEGKQVVTCYTCHQGHPEPTGTLVLPLPASVESAIALEEEKPVAPVLPSIDEILAKYIQALGGQQALGKVTSRMIVATQDLSSGPGGKVPLPAQIERYQKTPNLSLTIAHIANGTLSEGFDGKSAWNQNLKGVVADVGPTVDQARARRNAGFYSETLDLKQQYTKMEVSGVARVNGTEAYEVIGYPANDAEEKLYFDVVTGLLLRKSTILPTPLGNSPFQVDYADYKETSSGLRFPFTMRMTPATPRAEPSTHSTMRIQKVDDNPNMDLAKFARPQSKPAQ